MKIVHLVLSNVYAGIEQHVNELTLDLERESEIDISIICNKEIASKFESSNINIIDNFSRRSPIGLIKLFLKLYKIKPDIIHTHGSKTTSVINLIKKFLNITHVATAHGIKNKTSVYKRERATRKTDVDRVRDGGIIRVVCLNFGFESERRERALSASGSGGRARANGEECVDAARQREARESEDEGAHHERSHLQIN